MKPTHFWLQIALILLSVLSCLEPAHAQGGATGGGSITESDLRAYMGKIDAYLMTSDGKATFPEIVDYDRRHPELTFHDLIQRVKPVVRRSPQIDPFGIERDCVSYIFPKSRYFVCNLDRLPEKNRDNQPKFYRIVLHELCVQAGIEIPLNQNVSSDYSVSYRITDHVHLETYQEWTPGKLPEKPILQNGLWCSDHPTLTKGADGFKGISTRLLFWRPDGKFFYSRFTIPNRQYYTALNKSQNWFDDLRHLTDTTFGKKSHLEILYRGTHALPTNEEEGSAKGLSSPLRSKYLPLCEDNRNELNPYGKFFFGTDENVILQPSSKTIEQGQEMWNEVYAKILVPTKADPDNAPILVQCMDLESWSEDDLYNFFPSLDEIFTHPDKDDYSIDFTYYPNHQSNRRENEN